MSTVPFTGFRGGRPPEEQAQPGRRRKRRGFRSTGCSSEATTLTWLLGVVLQQIGRRRLGRNGVIARGQHLGGPLRRRNERGLSETRHAALERDHRADIATPAAASAETLSLQPADAAFGRARVPTS